MSHYASSLCILKVKQHLLNDLQNALTAYQSRDYTDEHKQNMINQLYINMQCEKPYYPEWLLGYASFDRSYVEEVASKIAHGFHDDNVYIVETTAAKIWHQQSSIDSTLRNIADAFIIIQQCEDSRVSIESENLSMFDNKYVNLITEQLKIESVRLNQYNIATDEYQHLVFDQYHCRDRSTSFGYPIEDDFYED